MRCKQKKTSRIQLGSESCERLLPCVSALAKAKRNPQARISLLTPLVTEDGIEHIQRLIHLLDKEDEVFVNDRGVLAMLCRDFQGKIFVGRLLSKTLFVSLSNIHKNKRLLNEFFVLLGPRVCGVEVDYFSSDFIVPHVQGRLEVRHCDRPLILCVTRRCILNPRCRPFDKFASCRKECVSERGVVANRLLNKKFLFKENSIIGLGHGNSLVGIDVPEDGAGRGK